MLLPALKYYFESLDTNAIPPDRQAVLDPLTAYIREKRAAGLPVRLIFICTHNSRRSHFGQVWAQVAASYYAVTGVMCYSGGTEATACNPRTVAALERAGIRLAAATDGENPEFSLLYAEDEPPVRAFSKVYDQAPNPASGFAAVMTCSQAEENCPYIPGAEKRFPVMYEDPKVADGRPDEATVYDARCRQIAGEMRYVFGNV